MQKRRIQLVLALLIGSPILILMIWSFWPLPVYDESQVCPQLVSLQTPYQNVRTVMFLDGGSVGIEIVDKTGRHEQFSLPCGWYNTNYPAYSRVFTGALWNHRPGAIELTNATPTKWKLVEILQNHSNRTAYDDAALAFIRKRPMDYARVLIHHWRSDFSPTNDYIR